MSIAFPWPLRSARNQWESVIADAVATGCTPTAQTRASQEESHGYARANSCAAFCSRSLRMTAQSLSQVRHSGRYSKLLTLRRSGMRPAAAGDTPLPATHFKVLALARRYSDRRAYEGCVTSSPEQGTGSPATKSLDIFRTARNLLEVETGFSGTRGWFFICPGHGAEVGLVSADRVEPGLYFSQAGWLGVGKDSFSRPSLDSECAQFIYRYIYL